MMIWEYIVFITIVVFLLLYYVLNYYAKCKKNICVVVLGDLGRSPRMQYHCISFAKEGFEVDVVAYAGSTPCNELLKLENIAVHYMIEPPGVLYYLPNLLRYAVKTIWQSVILGLHLLMLPKSAFHLVQNPPCIPTLAVTRLVCVIRSSHLIVDWHNYAYSILALSLHPRHALVRFSKWYEKTFGRLAERNICVTRAMQKDLLMNWSIKSCVLYDKPPQQFRPCDLSTSHDLFTKLSAVYPRCFSGIDSRDTSFTEIVDDKVQHKAHRPALMVSSTSWTEDEDFSILLDALELYELGAQGGGLPDLVVAITGKGPLKEFYRKELSLRQWDHVAVCMPWLEPDDYPLLLASADVGVCLHKSSSGLDLPMKVVDMFGCGLPVCAISFSCLPELVQHQVNGLVFDTSSQLASQVKGLLQGFPVRQNRLDEMRQNLAASFQQDRWHGNWKRVVLPLLRDI